MNRRRNTVLFLLGATVLNTVLMFFYFLTLMAVAGLFMPERTGWFAAVVWGGVFLVALTTTWFTYRWAFQILKDRLPLDRWLDPTIFKGLL